MNREHFQERIDRLEIRREKIRRAAEGMLLGAQETRGASSPLTRGESERPAAMNRDLADVDEQLEFLTAERDRCGTIPENLQRAAMGSGPMPGNGRINCRSGALVAPIDFGLEQLRMAHEKLTRGETALLESRASNTALPLPAELFPTPTFPIHEGRIADRLPAFAAETNSVDYVQVNSVTGEATVVAEGAVKPEIVLNVTKLTATCIKIAAHLGLTWESVQDFDAFTSSATTELQRLVIDKENFFLLAWFNIAGILTHPAANVPTFDDIEEAIAELRSGPSLAVADVLILSPATWSAIRREKDNQDRYYVSADPSAAEVNSCWGVPVVSTTACPDGEGWLLDSTKAGRLIVREPLAVRMGVSGDDFVRNIVRYVCEERCFFAVERPSAILHLTGLAPAGTRSASKTTSSSKSAKAS